MSYTISVRNLSKEFRVYKKDAGLKSTLKNVLRREYESICAVDNLSLDIKKGEFVGLIGPNGAGKSTTLKCLSGLITPTEGTVRVLGREPQKREAEYLKRISFIMGSKNQLWWDLPALDTLEFTKVVYDVSERDYKKRLDYLLEGLDLKDIAGKPVRQLSLGERMKFELVNSLIYIPEVLFLDEPTLGLDVVMQERIRKFLKEFNKNFGSTVILTSHYMEDVEDLCERVLLIDKGKILFDGDIHKLKHDFSIGKVISFDPKNKVKEGELNKFGKVEIKNGFVNITVKESEVNSISKRILSKYDVQDFEIRGMSLEEVVRDVFKNGV